MKKFIGIILASCLLLSSTAVFGQITGDLRGVVLDGQGGAVTGAKVALKSVETG